MSFAYHKYELCEIDVYDMSDKVEDSSFVIDNTELAEYMSPTWIVQLPLKIFCELFSAKLLKFIKIKTKI